MTGLKSTGLKTMGLRMTVPPGEALKAAFTAFNETRTVAAEKYLDRRRVGVCEEKEGHFSHNSHLGRFKDKSREASFSRVGTGVSGEPSLRFRERIVKRDVVRIIRRVFLDTGEIELHILNSTCPSLVASPVFEASRRCFRPRQRWP